MSCPLAQEQSDDELAIELSNADVLCLVYSCPDDDSLDRVSSHWLPLIRQTLGDNHAKPIVLAGTVLC